MMPFDKIAVVGTGLMGGSLAMALRQAGSTGEVAAYDVSGEVRDGARKLGIADVIYDEAPEAVRGAGVIFIATPVRSTAAAVEACAPGMGSLPIVSDLGSVKAGVIEDVSAVMPAGARYVGGHPMTGSEQSGVDFADPDLFKDRYYILTPTGETDPEAIKELHVLLTAIGARVISMDPETHDRAMATVSHVPHLLSLMLMNMASSEREKIKSIYAIAAGGFRDMTRISGSDPDLWAGIIEENRRFVIERLEDYSTRISWLVDTLRREDNDALRDMFASAQDAREELSRRSGAYMTDLYNLMLPVTDEPGVISGITTAVGSLGINIEDIGISHPLEGETGTMTLKVFGEERAREAASHLETLGYRVSLGKV
jgi:prephenate dehydrogenase